MHVYGARDLRDACTIITEIQSDMVGSHHGKYEWGRESGGVVGIAVMGCG